MYGDLSIAPAYDVGIAIFLITFSQCTTVHNEMFVSILNLIKNINISILWFDCATYALIKLNLIKKVDLTSI